MREQGVMMRRVRSIGTVLGVVLFLVGAPRAGRARRADAATPGRNACAETEHRQFDFWAGDWDAYDVGDPARVEARVRVDIILGGCVLREVYEGRDGLTGQSFSLFDHSRKVWHQTWVTDRGQLLALEGGKEGDRMVLVGVDRAADGTPRQVRGAWRRVEGGVRETAEVSRDRGRTWTPWFDIVFRPHE